MKETSHRDLGKRNLETYKKLAKKESIINTIFYSEESKEKRKEIYDLAKKYSINESQIDSLIKYYLTKRNLPKGNIINSTDFINYILKNIYNEFVVYIHRLNTTDLDWNKMMAMIVYKNLFPRDFNELQLGKGFVFELFGQKPFLIDKILSSEVRKKQELIDRMKWAKEEVLVSQKELDDAYSAKIERLPLLWGSLTPDG